MRKFSMKRKSKTPNSELSDEKSGDESPSTSNDQELPETNESPKKRGRRSIRSSKADENGKKSKIDDNASDDENEQENDDEEDSEDSPKPKKGKKGRKSEENGTIKKSKKGKDDSEEDYEVEAVVNDKMVKGVRHYLIKWKGYDDSGNTWEPQSTLNCQELIEEYLKSKDIKSGRKGKHDKSKKKKIENDADDDEEEDEKDYEVDKIIDVYFKRNGQREFLVHWKGYANTDNTWEPEENMNCQDLIEKFMAKVQQAKAVETKELRVKRIQTQRFTLSTHDAGRKLSKRNLGKQRVHYYDAE